MRFRIRSFIFSKTTYLFHDFFLKDLKESWQNPYGITFNLFDENDYEYLDEMIKATDISEQFFDIDETK